ncbi:hypothetical protein [Empedobacter sp. GD03865]|uniref:HYC_CC_PP family protein n=1 Tax=Empedobacter sp. GD03865 TaxID=2975392 RepID=UPI00244B38B6|nr:hypothetical protein [Empedobacter sp. GD03865]MDH0658174.1 hypothetical protein [Empedobacter sp. GD03865]
MQQYIKYVLSVVLIFSNLSYSFSMHFCQGEMEQVTMNHLDNNSCKMEVSTSCCPPKTEKKHCELPENNKSKKDDCCKDISYSDKFVEKQTVKIQKLIPISFIVSEILQIRIPIQDEEVSNQSSFLDFYVASNAPPNYILNSQLTFYEG